MPIWRSTCLASTVALGLVAAPVQAEVAPGAYLAARQALSMSEFAQATDYFSQAMVADPDNPMLLENALTAFVSLGQIESARDISRRMIQTGADSQLANMVLLGADAKSGDWENVLEDLDAGQSVGPLFDDLLRGWTLIGEGRVSDALEQFDSVIEQDGVSAFGLYHKALALASVGDLEGAAEIMSGDENDAMRLNRSGIVAYAQVLSQLDRNDDAIALLDEGFGGDLDPALAQLRARLADGERVPVTAIRDATDGVAEIYMSIAGALGGETSNGYILLYVRMAQYLRPDLTEATLMAAGLLERLGQYDQAIAAYRRVSRDDPAFAAAEMGRAEALRSAGRDDAAIEVMQQLSELQPDNPAIHTALGDALRQLERYEEAATAYDAAIAQFDSPAEPQWVVYFARAIAYERTDRWDEAEADFRTALELNPKQPQVLNYLGYSYVEMGENLDEALTMIEEAVAARPDSGYITDSLGWAYYRLGRFQEAVEPMEKAVSLVPVDPVINDHLGDVYWAVGRKLEARFQWSRALSFIDDDTSTDADPDRIRRKLEVGLDKVLEEEGEEPLDMARDGG